MTKSRVLSILGYTGFFLFCFVLFAYWTFPYDRVADYLTKTARASNSGYEIEIGELSPYWLTGVEVEDVKVYELGPGATTDEEPNFVLREGRGRVSILSELLGERRYNFDLELPQGELEGSYAESEEGSEVEAELSDLDLGSIPVLEKLLPLPLVGTLRGDIDLNLGANPKDSSGTIAIELEGLVVGDGKAKLDVGMMGGLTIDPVDFGTVTLEVDLDNGVGKVKKLSSSGTDVVLSGSGEITIATPVSRSRVSLDVNLKVSDNYKNKTDRTKAMFSLLESGSNPQLKRARGTDGSYNFRLIGTLTNLRAAPGGPTTRPRR